MTSRELRRKYLQFFESKGHQQYPSGSLIPFDVTGHLDESLLFTGAGMVQFKPFFRGIAQPPHNRLITAQKCVRTGDIETVGDLTHLTFFEMLGNFSFGDYFKQEAIAYSWEFLTDPNWLGLDPRRLSFTVFEEDEEAYGAWSQLLVSAGIDPATRVFRLGEETNYWPAGAYSKGPPGPCGPNSEMFYWTSNDIAPPSGDYTAQDYLRDESEGLWLEIWNDVFIQFEWQGKHEDPARPDKGYEKTGMPSLPFKSVDTGMGLERTSVVLAGLKSIYDIDVFQPILRRIEQLSNGTVTYGDDEMQSRAMRVIADHIRTASFCIADGVLPGNSGRGYVLRRLIRRAILQGRRRLGFEQPFFAQVFEGMLESMGESYPELIERQEIIAQTLGFEEALFLRTLERGLAVFDDYVLRRFQELVSREASHFAQILNLPVGKDRYTFQSELAEAAVMDQIRKLFLQGAGESDLDPIEMGVMPGQVAFMMYDTYGFPLEVLRELCEDYRITIDEEGYRTAMLAAQERSRASSSMDTVYAAGDSALDQIIDRTHHEVEFVGYDSTEATGHLTAAAVAQVDNAQEAEWLLEFDVTPFYAESGGQVGDTGTIQLNGLVLDVIDTKKVRGKFVHLARAIGADTAEVRQVLETRPTATLLVDAARRDAIKRNHTATHLLHAALRSVLGTHVTQAGSLVSPEHLRFDFAHGQAMTHAELALVERMVNEEALQNYSVQVHQDIPLAEARARGAMALFGEKYGDKVRMIEIGDFSKELCGGTHVRATGEIGLFKIVSEGSAAAGVRRIVAMTGMGAYDWVVERERVVRDAAGLLRAAPHDLHQAIERSIEERKDLQRKLERLRSQASLGAAVQTYSVGQIELAIEQLHDLDAKEATHTVDRLVEGKPNRVALAALTNEGKLLFACKVGPEAVKLGAHAGNLVRELAKLTGGGGGGKPDFATAGGKNPDMLASAIEQVQAILSAQIKA